MYNSNKKAISKSDIYYTKYKESLKEKVIKGSASVRKRVID